MLLSCLPALKEIGNTTFADIPLVVRLKITANGLTKIASRAFMGLTQMIKLDISNNINLARLEAALFDDAFR